MKFDGGVKYNVGGFTVVKVSITARGVCLYLHGKVGKVPFKGGVTGRTVIFLGDSLLVEQVKVARRSVEGLFANIRVRFGHFQVTRLDSSIHRSCKGRLAVYVSSRHILGRARSSKSTLLYLAIRRGSGRRPGDDGISNRRTFVVKEGAFRYIGLCERCREVPNAGDRMVDVNATFASAFIIFSMSVILSKFRLRLTSRIGKGRLYFTLVGRSVRVSFQVARFFKVVLSSIVSELSLTGPVFRGFIRFLGIF